MKPLSWGPPLQHAHDSRQAQLRGRYEPALVYAASLAILTVSVQCIVPVHSYHYRHLQTCLKSMQSLHSPKVLDQIKCCQKHAVLVSISGSAPHVCLLNTENHMYAQQALCQIVCLPTQTPTNQMASPQTAPPEPR